MRSPILQKTSAIAQEEIFTPGSCLSYIVPARWLEWSGAESCLESSQPSHAKNSVPFLPLLFFPKSIHINRFICFEQWRWGSILNHLFMNCTILCKCYYRATETIKPAFIFRKYANTNLQVSFTWGIKEFWYNFLIVMKQKSIFNP